MTSSGPFQSYFSMIQWKGNTRDEETQQIRGDRGEKDKYNKKGRRDETKRSGTKSKKYIFSNPLYAVNTDFWFFLMPTSSSWEIWTLALVKT